MAKNDAVVTEIRDEIEVQRQREATAKINAQAADIERQNAEARLSRAKAQKQIDQIPDMGIQFNVAQAAAKAQAQHQFTWTQPDIELHEPHAGSDVGIQMSLQQAAAKAQAQHQFTWTQPKEEEESISDILARTETERGNKIANYADKMRDARKEALSGPDITKTNDALSDFTKGLAGSVIGFTSVAGAAAFAASKLMEINSSTFEQRVSNYQKSKQWESAGAEAAYQLGGNAQEQAALGKRMLADDAGITRSEKAALIETLGKTQGEAGIGGISLITKPKTASDLLDAVSRGDINMMQARKIASSANPAIELQMALSASRRAGGRSQKTVAATGVGVEAGKSLEVGAAINGENEAENERANNQNTLLSMGNPLDQFLAYYDKFTVAQGGPGVVTGRGMFTDYIAERAKSFREEARSSKGDSETLKDIRNNTKPVAPVSINTTAGR